MLPYAPVFMRLGPRSREVLSYRVAYPRIHLGATDDLSRLLDDTRERLPEVRAPVLVVQGRRDWVIPRESAEVIAARVGSRVRRVVWLPRSRHVVTLDCDRQMLYDEVRRFLAEHLPVG